MRGMRGESRYGGKTKGGERGGRAGVEGRREGGCMGGEGGKK